MKYEMTHYLKDAAMWRKSDTIVGETTPDTLEAFTSMLGFKKTENGDYWKQEAYDQAIQIAIIEEWEEYDMTKREVYSHIYNLDISELVGARLQASHDRIKVGNIVADVLCRYDCNGDAIVALEMALREYFFGVVEACDREINHRLEEILNTVNMED